MSERSQSDRPQTVEPSRGDEWRPRDVWIGLLVLSFGVMVLTYAVAVGRGPFPMLLHLGAFVLGPIALLIGGNAVLRSLLAMLRSRDREADV